MLNHFVSYSFAIVGAEITSRNRLHFQIFAEVKDLLGDKPLISDHEFSHPELLQALITEEVNVVIHLTLAAHLPETALDGTEGSSSPPDLCHWLSLE